MCRRAHAKPRGWTMAFTVKNCVVILIVWTANLALTCPDSCHCKKDTPGCDGCLYETLPGYNVSGVILNMCCSAVDSSTPRTFRLEKVTTYINVTIINDRRCNVREFTLVAPNLTTTDLTLKNNTIGSFRLDVNGTNIKYLDLSQNQILKLDNNTFQNFTNLINLKIHSNKIQNVSTNCFVGLSNLQYLDLSNNKLTKLMNIFSPLKNLQRLNLSRNNLEHLSETSFNNGLLQHLDLSHNKLSKVAPGALQLLPNLARLLLADNPALGTTQLDGQLLVGTGRRLQQVDVSRTGLLQIPEAFTHSVRFLSLAGNKISSIHCGDLDSYPLLQSLDFTENRVVTIEDDSFGRLEMLLFLNLNNNLLITVPKMLPDELKYLSINNNLIKNLTIPDFNNLPNLRILLLQNNQIAYIQENVFETLSNLEVLELSNNPIQILTPSTFNGPVSLRDLRLCYLNISQPERDVTFPVPSPEGLQMLHLQSSPGLARQLLADSAVLAALSHLQYLDLRMNYLSDIRSDLVFYLSQLHTLRLHGNKINCTSADWLQEWMSWNQTSTQNETCYFSVMNGNEDENRYNCTFSETFTINDSLPPVNLYSTEMINKLLRYYGYLNNKTELIVHGKVHSILNSQTTDKLTSLNNTVSISRNDALHSNSNLLRYNSSYAIVHDSFISNEIDHTEETKLAPKTRSTNEIITMKNSRARIVNQNLKAEDENNDDKRIIDAKMNPLSHINENPNKSIETITNIKYGKIKTGKTVNKPINRRINRTEDSIMTRMAKTTHSITNGDGTQTMKISALTLLNSLNATEISDTATLQDRSESSPFQASSHSYASYVGVFAVTSLLVVCLVLWASLRLRYRQRRRTSLEQENEDHIEVASISGGVLW